MHKQNIAVVPVAILAQVFEQQFAGPCAQGVLDTVIVPRPMSLGRPGLFVLFKDNAFLGTSAHESVPLVGYSLATRWIIVVGRDLAKR